MTDRTADHAGSSEHGVTVHLHHHHHPGETHPPAPLAPSMLRMSAGARMAAALAISGVLWVLALWATS